MKFPTRCHLAIVFLLTHYYATARHPRAENPPNMIVILADDLGYGDLGAYGHPLIRTENLDQMAEEGIRLTSFYVAASTCTPSRAALLTGRYPLRSGLPHVIFPAENKGLPEGEITLAEALKHQGYQTMCVGKWHLGQTQEEYLPTSQGFDHYFGLITSNDMTRAWVRTDVPLRLYRDSSPTKEDPVDQQSLITRYTRKAIQFIEEANGNPFFLYLPHSMPHVPLHVSARFRGRSAAGLYGDVIEALDWSVGEILKTLKKNGLDKNTILVFTSDNGPWQHMPGRMFLQDKVKPWHAGSAGLLRGAKGTSYEGGFRVPCIIRWPEGIPAQQVSSRVVTSMDLYTTLVLAAGGTLPQDRPVDGVDIMPLLRGVSAFRRKKDFYYFQGKQLEAIRSGQWKLRIAPYQGHGKPPNDKLAPELYQLLLDPSEQHNVAGEHPQIVRMLKEKMKTFTLEGAEKKF